MRNRGSARGFYENVKNAVVDFFLCRNEAEEAAF